MTLICLSCHNRLMGKKNKDSEDKESLLNPLHGGDSYSAAVSLRDEDFTSLRPEDLDEKVDFKNFNKIMILCIAVTVAWLLGYGLFYLYSLAEEKKSARSQINHSSGYQGGEFSDIQPGFFEKIFCSGARKSSFCD